MDRNTKKSVGYSAVRLSLSARRAWIEITSYYKECTLSIVALRKESVDRNSYVGVMVSAIARRSPQGERG